MIGLDTNILVRYLTQDDPEQAKRANRIIDRLTPENPGFVPLVALVELVWVLESCYHQDKQQILAILRELLSTRQLRVETADIAWVAMKRFEAGKADFSDALIAVSAEFHGCETTLTFDKNALSIGMRRA